MEKRTAVIVWLMDSPCPWIIKENAPLRMATKTLFALLTLTVRVTNTARSLDVVKVLDPALVARRHVLSNTTPFADVME